MNEKELAELLLRAMQHHHIYQTTVLGGVRNPNWHQWYANYMMKECKGKIMQPSSEWLLHNNV